MLSRRIICHFVINRDIQSLTLKKKLHNHLLIQFININKQSNIYLYCETKLLKNQIYFFDFLRT